MTRAPFSGPVNSNAGFEVGSTAVITSDGALAELSILSSTELTAALPSVASGTFRLFYSTPSSAFVLKSSDGVLGTIDITS